MYSFFALIILIALPVSAHAYIDPGTGSMVVQLLIAGVAGVGVLIKMFWRRIYAIFRPGTPDGASNLKS